LQGCGERDQAHIFYFSDGAAAMQRNEHMPRHAQGYACAQLRVASYGKVLLAQILVLDDVAGAAVEYDVQWPRYNLRKASQPVAEPPICDCGVT
jgi:hypothetical protein